MEHKLKNTITNIKNDWLQLGIMLIVAYFIVNKSDTEKYFNIPIDNTDTGKWFKSVLLLLVGIALYEIFIVNIIDINNIVSIKYVNILSNVFKIGTMLIMARLLSGSSLNDPIWMKSLIYTLVGLATYEIVTIYAHNGQYIQPMTTTPEMPKYAVTFAVLRVLMGQPIDAVWLKETLAELIGFSIYDFINTSD